MGATHLSFDRKTSDTRDIWLTRGMTGLSVIAMLCAVAPVHAVPYDSTKIIEWTFAGAVPAGAMGTYEWKLNAFADDVHTPPPPVAKNDETAAPNTWAIAAGLPAVTKTSGVAGGVPHPESEAQVTFAPLRRCRSGTAPISWSAPCACTATPMK